MGLGHSQSRSPIDLDTLVIPDDPPVLSSQYLFPDPTRRPVQRRRNHLQKDQRSQLLDSIERFPLNHAQREVVETMKGPLVVLAGAGSGKTSALANRVGWLVGTGQPVTRIFVGTFTKKATHEIKTRIKGMIGPYVKGMPSVSTLHGLGLKIIEDSADLLGYKKGLAIIDHIFARKLLERGVKALSASQQRELGKNATQVLAAQISEWKNQGISPKNALKMKDPLAPGYVKYQTLMFEMGFIDVDDVIRLPVALFTEVDGGKEKLAQWQREFDFVMVDEHQDTNHVQEALITLLARNHGNLCVVGDDDQAIYEWRGANVENIRTFSKRWEPATTVALELNYRSTPPILDVANKIMARSTQDRGAKVLRATKEGGMPPRLYSFHYQFAP